MSLEWAESIYTPSWVNASVCVYVQSKTLLVIIQENVSGTLKCFSFFFKCYYPPELLLREGFLVFLAAFFYFMG